MAENTLSKALIQSPKKNQGDEGSTAYAKLHNDLPIIMEQEDNFCCPVNSFKHYLNFLNPNLNDFFQKPNKAWDGFDAAPLGKNTLGTMMKTISEKAGLSRIYTNHKIRSSTATAMHKQKFDLREIQNVTKHKNLQSLDRCVGGPDLDDKKHYSDALYKYATTSKKWSLPAPDKSKEPELKIAKIGENNEENVEPLPPGPQGAVAAVNQVPNNIVQHNQTSSSDV